MHWLCICFVGQEITVFAADEVATAWYDDSIVHEMQAITFVHEWTQKLCRRAILYDTGVHFSEW